MTRYPHPCPDLDQLLRLIGILGEPGKRFFWKEWRPNEDGYGYTKIKGGVVALFRETGAVADDAHDSRAHDFADYVLMLFATSSQDEERALVDLIGSAITSGDTTAVGTHFLADLRATAWRVWRDHHAATADDTVKWWTDAAWDAPR
ncbi:hypothetical protein [Streptomyces adustus]|uniref:hypothetical protein n=1 Tax=Streptomyces adustus TaxID=1609272 RepID=UPI0037151BCE